MINTSKVLGCQITSLAMQEIMDCTFIRSHGEELVQVTFPSKKWKFVHESQPHQKQLRPNFMVKMIFNAYCKDSEAG